MYTTKIAIDDLIHAPLLFEEEEEVMAKLHDGDADPLIVSDEGKGTYELIDGYHRLGGMVEAGEKEVTVIVVTEKELELCREFGPGDMPENDWIDWIQETEWQKTRIAVVRYTEHLYRGSGYYKIDNRLIVAGQVYRHVAQFEGTELHVVDFDNCLFKSPDKPDWWVERAWWSNESSLQVPCVPEKPSAAWWNSDIVSEAKKSIADETVYTVMITGRVKDQFAKRITDLLNQKGLKFDELRFKQVKSEKTSTYKARHLRSIAKKFQDQIKTVQIWDDQQENLDEVKSHLEERGIKVLPHYVEPQVKEVDCTEKEYDKKRSTSKKT